jgi:hypothetical protein
MPVVPITTLAMVLALAGTMAADESDPQFAGSSFIVYHATGDGQSHRCSLTFGRQGAKMDLFDGVIIPATGSLKTKRQGRRGSVISEFSAKGESPYGKGTIAFSATKDGEGAKGSVTLTMPGKDPVTVTFTGTAPAKK